MLNEPESTRSSSTPEEAPESPRPPRVRRDGAGWAAIVAQQRASGLSIVAFCRRHGLAVSTFHAWKRRLEAEPSSSHPDSLQPAAADSSTPESVHPGFVRLQPASAADQAPSAGASSATFDVRFDRGATLRCPADRLDELVSLLLADPDSDAGDHRC